MNPEDFEAMAATMGIKVVPVTSTNMSVSYWLDNEFDFRSLVNILTSVQAKFLASAGQHTLTIITRSYNGRDAYDSTPH